MTKNITYATLKKDFTFEHPFGEPITWEAGKRFRINHLRTYGNDGCLYLENYFAYGCPLQIPAEYLHPRKTEPTEIEKNANNYPTRLR